MAFIRFIPSERTLEVGKVAAPILAEALYLTHCSPHLSAFLCVSRCREGTSYLSSWHVCQVPVSVPELVYCIQYICHRCPEAVGSPGDSERRSYNSASNGSWLLANWFLCQRQHFPSFFPRSPLLFPVSILSACLPTTDADIPAGHMLELICTLLDVHMCRRMAWVRRCYKKSIL